MYSRLFVYFDLFIFTFYWRELSFINLSMLKTEKNFDKQKKQNRQTESLSLEFDLINRIAAGKNHPQEHQFKNIPNLSLLGQRIKIANQNLLTQNSVVSSQSAGLDWMKSKGVNLQTLMIEIQKQKKEIVEEATDSAIEEWKIIQNGQVNSANRRQYFRKYQEVVVMKSVVNSLSSKKNNASDKMRSWHKKILTSRMLSKDQIIQTPQHNQDLFLKDHINFTQASQFQEKKILKGQKDKKKSLYLRSLSSCLPSFTGNQLTSFHKTLYDELKNSKLQWFQILIYQIQAINSWKNESANPLAYASITALENILSSMIQDEGLSLLQFLKKHYIEPSLATHQRESRNIDPQLDERWGVLYLMYRSGRKEQFFAQLNKKDSKLRNSFMAFDQNMARGKATPQPSVDSNALNCDFYRQLAYVVRGKLAFGSNRIIDRQHLLDEPWVVLNTLGVYREKGKDQVEREYWGCVQQIFNTYLQKANKPSVAKILSLIALGAYEQMARLFETRISLPENKDLHQYFGRTDYVHFLILLYVNKDLFEYLSDNSYNYIRKAAIKETCRYSKQLRQSQINEYEVYFFTILSWEIEISQHELYQAIDQVCIAYFQSKKDVQLFDWKSLESYLQGAQYKEQSLYSLVVESVLQNLPIFDYQDYIFVANHFRILLGDSQREQKMLIKMLLSEALQAVYLESQKDSNGHHARIISGVYEDEQQKKAKQLIKKQKEKQLSDVKQWLKNRPSISTQSNEPIIVTLLFFLYYQDLKKILESRRYQRLRQFDNQHWRFSGKYSSQLEILLSFLGESEEGTIDLYIDYLLCLNKRNEIFCHERCEMQELNQLKISMGKEVEILLAQKPQFRSSKLVKKLKNELNQRY